MFYKQLKYFFLSTLALFWGACENADESVAGYGCLSSRCYNSTAETSSGKTFDIIECDNGYKYLRHPKLYYEDPEVRDEIDKDLFFREDTPYPDERCEASNCKYIGSDICYEKTFNDLTGGDTTVTICVPTIDCPEKP